MRAAIIKAIEYLEQRPDAEELEALDSVFQSEGQAAWETVYGKIWSLLQSGALRKNGRCIEAGAINIVDLSGMDMLARLAVGEAVLSWVWRVACCSGLPYGFRDLTIVLDEFQHFSLKMDGTLRGILSEGRKFGINLILGTQSFDIFSKEELSLLNQASTHLYFKPPLSEANKAAKLIDASHAPYWKERLLQLNVGECISVGEMEVGGMKVRRPLVLT